MKIYTKNNEEITCQNDVITKYNLECYNEYTYKNIYSIISTLLKDPSNKINAYKYLKIHFRFEHDDIDLLGYINSRCKSQYSKVVTIPTDEVKVSKMVQRNKKSLAYNLFNVNLKCAATNEFNLKDGLYSIAEINNLVLNGVLLPIGKEYTDIKNIPEKINVFQENENQSEKASLIHCVKDLSKLGDDSEYYSYFVSKTMDFIGLKNVLSLVRNDIIFLYSYQLNIYYNDMYFSDFEESISEEEYFKDVYDLILNFNKVASLFNIETISIDAAEVFAYYNSFWYEGAKNLFLIRNKFSNEQANKIENDIIETADEDLFESILNFYPDALYDFNISKIINSLVERNILNDEIDEYRALEYLTYYQKYLNEKNTYSLLIIVYKSKNKDVIYKIKNLGYNLEGCKTRSRKKKN